MHCFFSGHPELVSTGGQTRPKTNSWSAVLGPLKPEFKKRVTEILEV